MGGKAKHIRGFVVLFAACAALTGSAGCALLLVGGGGAAGYAYVAGKHERLYPYPLAQTWEAVLETVRQARLPTMSERSDAFRAKLESQLATGEKVTITLDHRGPSATEVGIRVGVFGDSDTSHMLFEQIDAHLPGGYAPPKPDVHVGVSVSR